MAVNSAFHTSNLHSLATERSLYQNLVKEAIQIYGHDVYYVNRDTVALDNVLGEDSLSKYTKQTPIESKLEDGVPSLRDNPDDGNLCSWRQWPLVLGMQHRLECR